MFDNIASFLKKMLGGDSKKGKSKDTAKERLHLVLVQDRASVSADFLDAMKQEIIEVIKKYIEVDENAIDVRLTNNTNDDGTNGAPALYANIPITNVKVADVKKADEQKQEMQQSKQENTLYSVLENNDQNEKLENNNQENEQNNEENIEEQIEKKQENPEETEKEEVVNTTQNN